MSLRINHNTQALNSHRQLLINDRAMGKSLEKLSSGMKINRAADGPAQLMISEQLRSQLDMLEAENQRLHDKVDSEDFLNGALAVLLGVIITLVVPRLWPKRRKSSSWA